METSRLVLIADRGFERFEIVEDKPEVGFYIWRYDLAKGRSTHDYLQNDLDIAKECALEEFGIPPEAWRVPDPDDAVIAWGQWPSGWGPAAEPAAAGRREA